MDKDLELIFREDYAGLCRYTCRIVSNPDDAVEIVQETFLRFHRMRARYTSAPDRVLLYRIARNLAIDCLRRGQTRKRQMELHGHILVMPVVESTEEQLMAQESREQLRLALQSLKPKDAECLTLRNEGHCYVDIALILDIHPGSVGPTITRALRKLRNAYLALTEKPECTAGPSTRDKHTRTDTLVGESALRFRVRSTG
jgi:RNA polymerase sigma-70 factor (ECF subfamily)